MRENNTKAPPDAKTEMREWFTKSKSLKGKSINHNEKRKGLSQKDEKK